MQFVINAQGVTVGYSTKYYSAFVEIQITGTEVSDKIGATNDNAYSEIPPIRSTICGGYRVECNLRKRHIMFSSIKVLDIWLIACVWNTTDHGCTHDSSTLEIRCAFLELRQCLCSIVCIGLQKN